MNPYLLVGIILAVLLIIMIFALWRAMSLTRQVTTIRDNYMAEMDEKEVVVLRRAIGLFVKEIDILKLAGRISEYENHLLHAQYNPGMQLELRYADAEGVIHEPVGNEAVEWLNHEIGRMKIKLDLLRLDGPGGASISFDTLTNNPNDPEAEDSE